MSRLFHILLGLGATLLLAGCGGPSGYTNRAFVQPAFDGFGRAFQDVRAGYIEPIEPSVLFGRVLNGLKSNPALMRPGPQAILSNALTRGQAIHEEANAPYLNLFADTVDALLDDPQAPSRLALVRAALAGMLDGLDTATAFHSPIAGPVASGDVGLELMTTRNGEGMRIVRVLPRTPASRSGMLPGDVLVAIDGQPVVGRPWEPVIDQLRGPVGSHVRLTVRREASAVLVPLVVERNFVSQQSVELTRLNNVAYVRLGHIVPGTAKLLHQVIAAQLPAGVLHGLIVDLRNNTGGRLDEAVSVCARLLPLGTPVATVEGRTPELLERFVTTQVSDVTPGTPTVVLVNGNTASGSEMIVAALRQGRHAIIMGSRTAGSGLVATVVSLGELGMIRFSTGRIILASGQPLGAGGLIPDVALAEAKETYAPYDPSRDPAVQAALHTLQAPDE